MSVTRSAGYRVRRVGAEPVPPDEPELVSADSDEIPVPAAEASRDSVGHDLPAQPRRPATGRRGLSVVAALGVAGTVGFGSAWWLGRSQPSQPTAVKTAAADLVTALTNFNPGTVGADFSRIEKDATGAFSRQAHKVFGSSIRTELASAHAASRGKIDDLYIQSVRGGHATVFAVVTQTYLNAKQTLPVHDTLRLVIGLTDDAGSWKASSVEVLQQPVTPVGTTSGGGSTTSSPHSATTSGSSPSR